MGKMENSCKATFRDFKTFSFYVGLCARITFSPNMLSSHHLREPLKLDTPEVLGQIENLAWSNPNCITCAGFLPRTSQHGDRPHGLQART